MKTTTKTRATKSAARATPAETVAEQTAVNIASVYIARCRDAGIPTAMRGDGLPMREMFRDRCRAANAWTNGATKWGAHNAITDLHDWCIAHAVDRMGDAATPAGRKMRDAIRARGIPAEFVPAQWDIDVASRRAAFRAAPAASSRKRRAA